MYREVYLYILYMIKSTIPDTFLHFSPYLYLLKPLNENLSYYSHPECLLHSKLPLLLITFIDLLPVRSRFIHILEITLLYRLHKLSLCPTKTSRSCLSSKVRLSVCLCTLQILLSPCCTKTNIKCLPETDGIIFM